MHDADDLKKTWFRANGALLLTMLLLALILRMCAMVPVNFHHADAVWQYLEPAYHLAFGRWVVAWEYREGIRTWLIPTMLAGPMWLGGKLAPGTMLYLFLPRLFLVLISLSIVACSTAMGARISRRHAAMAGFVAAIWAEMVYFAPQALSDTVAIALFFPAALLLTRPVEKRTPLAFLVAGVLLGLCFSARFQLAPALGVLALWACGLRWRAWVWLVLGALLGLGVDAGVDALFGAHPPLRWIYENFRINLIEKKSESFGVDPWYWYIKQMSKLWKVALLGIIPLSILGAKRYPVLMWVALVNLVAHSFIPHKEYRFILLSSMLLVVLAAIGCVDFLQRRAIGHPRRLQRSLIIAAIVWATCSWATATHRPMTRFWMEGRSLIKAMELAGADPQTCGLALYQPPNPLTASYAYYHRDTPIYLFNSVQDRDAALRYSPAFNAVLSIRPAGALSPEYHLVGCESDAYCIYRRSGGCNGVVPSRYDGNEALKHYGK